ncbi:hypothetical protein ABGB12_27180 [Actinocorallia sp. B10E7]|uniref:hypothetical protein n=1 Tax=Actinocorallia sp. B10E7 TaxID=3153558 RepID=UPI00325CB5E1
MQCPSCATPASEGQSHCARCHAPLSALAGAYAAPTSSTEKTIMFDRAPWQPAEEPTGAWSSAEPAEPAGPAQAPEALVPEPFAPQAPAPENPAPAAPRPGEATEWWTPAMDTPSGPTPLPQQQAWSQPAAPEAPSVPAVPDSWFAGPAQEQAPNGSGSGGFPQVQTGPFAPVFDDARQEQPAEPVPPVAFPADSTFAAMGPSEPGPVRPGEYDPGMPYAHPGAPVSEPPYAQSNGLASVPPYDLPNAPVSEPPYVQPEHAQPGGLASELSYAQPEYVQVEYAQPNGLASEPPYAQPQGLASEPPYLAQQPGGHAYGRPQQGFSTVPSPGAMGGGFGQQSAWDAPREEKPLWDPDGPLPMTQSHRVPSANGGAKNKPLVIGVAALVVVALVCVLFVFLNGGDDVKDETGPSQTPVAQVPAGNKPADSAAVKQARKVQALLNTSAKSRVALSNALVKARSCADIPASVATMQQVAQQRQAQWKRAQRLNIPALPQAVKLRNALARSIKLSLDVDLAYLAWARSNQGCKGKTPLKGANYKRGDSLSAEASRSKSRFLEMWNQIAPQYGLAKRQSF